MDLVLPKLSRVVVALGGNAITRPGDDGSVEQDYANLNKSLSGIVDLVERGYEITLTHGNGPQVGNQMIRVELTRDKAPNLPLDMMVADLQGGIGYMIERVLRNKFLRRGLEVPVCTMVTLVEVRGNDPALKKPTKFVGPFFSADDARRLSTERGWIVKEDKGRGWRRVVPSPEPIAILEKDLIVRLMESGALVIDTGGGGVPVKRRKNGEIVGVEGVVDKDLASALLALEIGAAELFVLTGVEKVAIHYGTPQEKHLDEVTAEEVRGYLAEGHFPEGSMGPKMEAACRFVEKSGGRALITDIFKLGKALDGKTGTWVVP